MEAPKEEACYDDKYMSQLIGIGENLDYFNLALIFFVRMNYYRKYRIANDELEVNHTLCERVDEEPRLKSCNGEQEINYVFKFLFNTVFRGLSTSCKIKFFVNSLHSKEWLDTELKGLFKKITPLFIFCFYIQEFKKLFFELGIDIIDVFKEFLNHYSNDDDDDDDNDKLKKQFEVSKLPKEFTDFNGKKKDLFRRKLLPITDKVNDDELIKYQINNYLLKNIQNLSYFFLLAVNGQKELLEMLYGRTKFTMSNETENTEKNLLGYLTLLFGHPDVALYLKSIDTEFNFEKPEPEFFPTQFEIIDDYTKKDDSTTIKYRFFNKFLETRPIEEIKDEYEAFDPRSFYAGGGCKKKKRKIKSNRKHRKSIKKNIKRRKSKIRKTRRK